MMVVPVEMITMEEVPQNFPVNKMGCGGAPYIWRNTIPTAHYL